MFKIARPSNFWMFKAHNGLTYAKLPLRLLACCLFFLVSSVAVLWLYPPVNITTIQFCGFGLVAFSGLLVAAEFVFQNFMQRTYWKRSWHDLVMHELFVPAGIAAFIFYNIIIGPINFFDPEPIEPTWPMIAAKRWAWAFFPALGLFYGLLWLIEYRIAVGGPGLESEDDGTRQIREFNFVAQIDNALFTEIRRQHQVNWVVDMTWREEAKAYLETSPKAFNKYRYYLGNAAAVPIYSYYSLDVMVIAYNHCLAGDKLILVNSKNEDGSGEAKLVFRGRHERFPIPESLPDMDKVVSVMAKLLMPDYELRHCRLASRHRILQSLMCLQPEQWAELTDTYGKRKMRKYFSPIDDRFKSLAFADITWETRFFNVLARYESPL